MSNRIILPKKDKEGKQYLSYSQITTWKKNKRDYMRQYFFGESFDGNQYTDFGKQIGEALENNDFSAFTEEEQKLLKTIPRYDEFEREIKLECNGFYVKGYIDSNTKTYKKQGKKQVELVEKILDYKTGEIDKKYGDYSSPDYTQLDIYAAGILQDTGLLPKEAKVILIQRDGNAYAKEKLTLGDKFVIIDREISIKRCAEIVKDIQKIAEEISSYYNVFLKLKTLI